MNSRVLQHDGRSIEEIREHYEIEKSLADRLRNATTEERAGLYSEVYDELFKRVKHHPLVSGKEKTGRSRRVASTLQFLGKFLHPDSTFLEIGPGDCALSFGVARFVQQVYAVDCSEEIMTLKDCPENCELVVCDGSDIPVKRNSVDVAYSKDLFEHLHPEDASDHLKNVVDVLSPGGVYICRTPNALSGPHDVSQFFDDQVPTGLHLKEYTTTELAKEFKAAGFSKVIPYLWIKGILIRLPLWPVVVIEGIASCLPRRLCKALTSGMPLKRVLGRVIATK